MLEHVHEIPPESRLAPRPGQRRHRHLLDQLRQKRPLRQDLHVQEIRRRLQRDRLQRLPPMQFHRRMHIPRRHREDQLPTPARDPSPQRPQPALLPPPHHMIRPIDRLEQRPQVLLPPRLARRRHQHERMVPLRQRPPHPLRPRVVRERLHHHVHPPHRSREQPLQPLPDLLRLPRRQLAQHHDQHARRPRHRLPHQVRIQWVHLIRSHPHPHPHRRLPHDPLPRLFGREIRHLRQFARFPMSRRRRIRL